MTELETSHRLEKWCVVSVPVINICCAAIITGSKLIKANELFKTLVSNEAKKLVVS